MSRLGPYEVLRALGSGGFAKTCEARHLLLGTKACLKVSLQEEDDALLLREAKILSALRHPNLPTLREVFEHPAGGLVLAMSFAEGKTLDRHPKLTPLEACRVGTKVLRALAYLHKGGIVHGDVKPQNIVIESLRKGGDVVLVDLGLASVRPDGATRPMGWSEGFAAPEVERGLPPLPESDLYALAKTLAFALEEEPEGELRDFVAALTRHEPARRPRWSFDSPPCGGSLRSRDPLVWLEEIQSSLEKEVLRV